MQCDSCSHLDYSRLMSVRENRDQMLRFAELMARYLPVASLKAPQLEELLSKQNCLLHL